MEKQRLFLDMDGTLAVFRHVEQLETLYEQGYFAQLPPIDNVLRAVKEVIRTRPDIEVHVLSAVLSDSKFALAEKNAWLDKYLPEISPARRIFPPCGEDKAAYIPGGVRATDCLLDDYTQNLALWQPPGKGIKLLNGINHTHGTWQHDCIRHDLAPSELADKIVEAMTGQAQNRPATLADRLADAKQRATEQAPDRQSKKPNLER